MNRRKAEVLNMVMRFRFPVGRNGVLDLNAAFEFLHNEFGSKVFFEPELNLKALRVEFDGLKFGVFSSGKAIIYGVKLDNYCGVSKIMNRFWFDYLSDFVKKKELV